MVLTALRALCVLLSALCAATHVLETVGVFRRWSHLNGFLVPSSFFRAEGKSRIQCSSVCLGDSECRSFTYEEDRRACYLHRSHWPLPGDSRPGAATFYRKWTHCPQGWDLLDENVCVKLISGGMSWQNAVQNECRSFTYEEDRRACYLHRSHWPLPGDSRPGAATFYRKWTHCPQDWDLLDENVCVKPISEKMSWQSALQNCLQLGGNLVSVETQAKESLLRTYLQARSFHDVWLGASDLEVEGQWKWEATGDTAHIRWWPGQPDNTSRDDCLGQMGQAMHDVNCAEHWKSVCQILL